MASSYLPQWKRQGKHNAVVRLSISLDVIRFLMGQCQVEFVSAGSRFKLYMPKEHTKVTFVLAGMSDPYSYPKLPPDISDRNFL